MTARKESLKLIVGNKNVVRVEWYGSMSITVISKVHGFS